MADPMNMDDVEALLESTARPTHNEPNSDTVATHGGRDDALNNTDRRSRDRDVNGNDRDQRRRRRSGERLREADGEVSTGRNTGEKYRAKQSKDRRRSTSRHRRSSDPDDAYPGSTGDYYRGGGRVTTRSRSRSPEPDRYRPGGRSHRDDSDRYRRRDDERDRDRDRGRRNGDRDRNRRRSRSPKRRSKSMTPQPTEDERDRRTVFVQQLAARLRTKELINFFEKVGPVKEAQIVKDRVSGRSKGVGYVEFKDEESVKGAIGLTGQKLLGIPIIAQLTEAEKNRQARNPDNGHSGSTGVPFHRLYVGNIHFSITEDDLQQVFLPFGELEFVQLQKEETGRSRGYGFVQFRNPAEAKEALEKMNGFDLAGRPIRVGLGNDKFTTESTASLLRRFNGQAEPSYQGSAFSGHGGRGAQAGGSGGTFDRAGGRDNDKGAGGASALDDTDVMGVNFNNFSRDSLMRKLARTDEPSTKAETKSSIIAKPQTKLPFTVPQSSRCIRVQNMFDSNMDMDEDDVKELEIEVKEECEIQYGPVVHIAVDRASNNGQVYLKFQTIKGAESAIQGLNGRFFAGEVLTAEFVVDSVYSSLFARSRAL